MPTIRVPAFGSRLEGKTAGESRRDPTGVSRLKANAREASELLKALAHEGRLMILCQLVEGERSVSDLAEVLKMRQPAVSQRLARLREDGLVKPRRDGKSVYYSISRPDVQQIVETLEQAFCHR